MVTIVVNFIVSSTSRRACVRCDRTHLELLRSLAAPPSDVLRKARIPNAVPYFFTSLKIAAPTAVITGFVSEYFGGRQNGLGYFIPSNFANSKTANRMGLRHRRVSAGSGVLPGLHPDGEHHTPQSGPRPRGSMT